MKSLRLRGFWIPLLNLLVAFCLWRQIEGLKVALDHRPPIALINREAWITHLPGESTAKDFEGMNEKLQGLLQPLRDEGYLVIDQNEVILAPEQLWVEP